MMNTRVCRAALICATLVVVTNLGNSYASQVSRSKNSPIQYSILRDENELLTWVSGGYLDTSRNFDASATGSALPTGHSVQQTTGAFGLSWGFDENWTAFAETAYKGTTANVQNLSVSEGNLGDLTTGIRFGFGPDKFPMVIELGAAHPLYNKPSSSDWSQLNRLSTVPPATGFKEYWLQYSVDTQFTDRFGVGIGSGAAIRTYDYANPFFANAYLKYGVQKDFFARLGFLYETPLQEDAYADSSPTSAERANTLVSGSHLMNSINPTALTLEGAAGAYITEKAYIGAGIQNQIWGKNTAQSISIQASLGIHFGGSKSHDKKPEYSVSKSKGYIEYDLSVNVKKVASNSRQILVDGGISEGFAKGQKFDIFEPDTSGNTLGNLVASARVTEVGKTITKMDVYKFYVAPKPNDTIIKEGFVARRPLD